MPVSRISISPAIRRRICWRISSGCGSISASSDGWSSACPGDRPWRSLMPSSIPSASAEMVLASVATTTASEIDWITRGIGIYFPEAWARFRDGVPEADRAGRLVDAYHRLLMDPDPAIHEKAARDWCDWEIALVALHPGDEPHPRYERSAFRLGFARLVTHYWRHNAWLDDGALLRGAGRLAGIPGVLIHGRLDLGTPLVTPWRLQRHWPRQAQAAAAAFGIVGRVARLGRQRLGFCLQRRLLARPEALRPPQAAHILAKLRLLDRSIRGACSSPSTMPPAQPISLPPSLTCRETSSTKACAVRTSLRRPRSSCSGFSRLSSGPHFSRCRTDPSGTRWYTAASSAKSAACAVAPATAR